ANSSQTSSPGQQPGLFFHATACRLGFRQLPLLPVRSHEGALSAALATNHAARQRPNFNITGIAPHVEHHFVPTRLIEARHQHPLHAQFAYVAERHRRAVWLLRHHSMTLSARARMLSEIVSPSSLAVLRFNTNSNLVGCSTGKSAGFAPLNILSTYWAALRN